MGKTISKKLFLDESRVWSFAVDKMQRKQLRGYLFGYFFHTNAIESYFRINLNTSKCLTGLTNLEKNANTSFTIEMLIRARRLFYSQCIVTKNIFETRAAYISVLKFNHENANGTF